MITMMVLDGKNAHPGSNLIVIKPFWSFNRHRVGDFGAQLLQLVRFYLQIKPLLDKQSIIFFLRKNILH